MRASVEIACIAALLFALTGCGGGSGPATNGTSQLSPADGACVGTDCQGEERAPTAIPATEPTKATEPTTEATARPGSPLACGGIAGVPCAQGYRCVDDPSDTCVPSDGGADCGGICILGEDLPHCGGLNGGTCPAGSVCADDPDDGCDGGPAVDCPGICRPASGGQCVSDMDCPPLRAPCSVCADGSDSCPKPYCENGQCTVIFRPCPEPQICDAISNLSCAPGFHCAKDPTAPCGPEADGIDCRGICVPDETPITCSSASGMVCAPGSNCVDDPNDRCDPENGGVDCPGRCEPASMDECQTDQDCPQLRAPCSVCADGTEMCASSTCDKGHCNIVFPTCGPPVVCGSGGTTCNPGESCVDEEGDGCDPATGAVCPGKCVSDNMPRSCGGMAGDSCPPSYKCVDDRRDECDPNAGGADCPGVCEAVGPQECTADAECVSVGPCFPCADGEFSCPRPQCLDGKCGAVYSGCRDHRACGGIAGETCPEGYACVDDSGDNCDPATGADCGGICIPSMEPQCRTDDECPRILAPCSLCADGSYSCPESECRNGVCSVRFEPCLPGFCGGVAGFPCPPGSTCIDDPKDECDPQNGGADCGGICVRDESPPQCGGVGGKTCPDGYDCVADGMDTCDPATGTVCSGVCRPAQMAECRADADCVQIGAPCRLCPDGSPACPKVVCADGQCIGDLPSCGGSEDPQP